MGDTWNSGFNKKRKHGTSSLGPNRNANWSNWWNGTRAIRDHNLAEDRPQPDQREISCTCPLEIRNTQVIKMHPNTGTIFHRSKKKYVFLLIRLVLKSMGTKKSLVHHHHHHHHNYNHHSHISSPLKWPSYGAYACIFNQDSACRPYGACPPENCTDEYDTTIWNHESKPRLETVQPQKKKCKCLIMILVYSGSMYINQISFTNFFGVWFGSFQFKLCAE